MMPSGPERTPVFNPAARIDTVRLANGQSCFVIDDALLAPERVVEFAAARRQDFRNVDFNAYPGVFHPPPVELSAALSDFFAMRMRRLFDARRTLHMHCRLSMVTLPPHALQPYQSMCHRDMAVLNPQHSIQASILYLFRDSTLGGTGFYEPARSAEDMAQLFDDATVLARDAFWHKYSMQPGYLCDSNSWFTRIGGVSARWNRLIFYDGYALHSGDITAPERLNADPQSGRLTLNGFFSSRRHAV